MMFLRIPRFCLWEIFRYQKWSVYRGFRSYYTRDHIRLHDVPSNFIYFLYGLLTTLFIPRLWSYQWWRKTDSRRRSWLNWGTFPAFHCMNEGKEDTTVLKVGATVECNSIAFIASAPVCPMCHKVSVARGSIGWVTMLQAGRSQIRFLMSLLDFLFQFT
jgi:hypothetical protein